MSQLAPLTDVLVDNYGPDMVLAAMAETLLAAATRQGVGVKASRRLLIAASRVAHALDLPSDLVTPPENTSNKNIPY